MPNPVAGEVRSRERRIGTYQHTVLVKHGLLACCEIAAHGLVYNLDMTHACLMKHGFLA